MVAGNLLSWPPGGFSKARSGAASAHAFRFQADRKSQNLGPNRMRQKTETAEAERAVAEEAEWKSSSPTTETPASAPRPASLTEAEPEGKTVASENDAHLPENRTPISSPTLEALEPAPQSNLASGLKIDKSKLLLGFGRRIRDMAHFRQVAELPCLVCNRQPSHAHHLRFGPAARAWAKRSAMNMSPPSAHFITGIFTGVL